MTITIANDNNTTSTTFQIQEEVADALTPEQQIKMLKATNTSINTALTGRIKELEQTIEYAKKNIDTRKTTIEKQTLDIIELQEKIKELQQDIITAIRELTKIQTEQNKKTSTGWINKTFNLTPDERDAQK
jgi:chromosome segregation ATPase